jgi:hypothetical protein
MSSHDSALWSWTFSTTIPASSYVTVNFGTSLCTFIFFLCRPSCNMGIFYCRVSICVQFVGIYIYGMYPPPCSSCVRTIVSFCVLSLVLFFGCSLFLVDMVRIVSYVGGFEFFFCCLGFLTVTPPALSFVHSATFLVFSVEFLVFCDVPASSGCFPLCPFLHFIVTFHSYR